MKTITRSLLFALLLASSGYVMAAPVPGAKISVSDIVDRHLSGFHAVDVAGSFDVKITQGATESVKVEAPADMMEHIKTEVNNGVLRVYDKNDHFHWGDLWGHHRKIVVYVTAKDLNAIDLSGSGDVDLHDGFTTNSMKLGLSGSGDLVGRLNVKTLDCHISGSGDVKLEGHADNSTVSIDGSGDFTARELSTVNSTIRVSGSGDAQINASGKIDASVAGSGDVRYSGAARVVNSHKSGSGDISRD